MLNLAPYWISRQFDNTGAMAAGAKLYTYRAGSTTPHPTYQNAEGTVSNTNPIILDSAGRYVAFLDSIRYRFYLTDAFDNLISDIDNIGSGGLTGGTGSFNVVTNYQALRNLDQDYDLIYVLGRNVANDGGQGLFVKSTLVQNDDDAITLVRQNSTRYLRDMDDVIDPRWAGVVYGGSVDQRANMESALDLSVNYDMPLAVGNAYVATNLTAPSGSRIRIDGSIYGPAIAPTIIFEDGSRLDSCSNGGLAINVQLGVGCASNILSSWFAGDPDTVIARIAALSDNNYTVTINDSYAVGVDINIPSNIAIDFAAGGLIDVAIGGIDIVIGSMVYNGNSQIIRYSRLDYVNQLDIGTNVKPQWFGAAGDGITDDTFSLAICAKSTGTIDMYTMYRQCGNITGTDVILRGTTYVHALEVVPEAINQGITFGFGGTTYSINTGTLSGSPVPLSGIGTDIDPVTSVAELNAQKYVAGYNTYVGTLNGGVFSAVTNTKRIWSKIEPYSGAIFGTAGGVLYKIEGGVETVAYSGNDVSPEYITANSSTIYACSDFSYLYSWNGSTLNQVGSTSNLYRDLTWYDGVLYAICKDNIQDSLTDIYTINLTTAAKTKVTSASAAFAKMSVYNNKLYVVIEGSELHEVNVSTGAITPATTNMADKYWFGLSGTSDTLYALSSSRSLNLLNVPYWDVSSMRCSSLAFLGVGNIEAASNMAAFDVAIPDTVVRATRLAYVDSNVGVLASAFVSDSDLYVTNSRKDNDYNNIYNQHNSHYKGLYLDDLAATGTATFDKMLAVDGNGLVYGTKTPVTYKTTEIYLEKVHVRYNTIGTTCNVYSGIYSGSQEPSATTLCYAYNLSNGETPEYVTKISDPPFYSLISDNDNTNCQFRVSGAPSNSDHIMLAYVGTTNPPLYVSSATSYNGVFRLPHVNTFFSNTRSCLAHGVRVGSKYSWG